MGPRIFEAERASEIGGVRGYGGSVEVLGLGLRSANTRARSPALFAGAAPPGLGSRRWAVGGVDSSKSASCRPPFADGRLGSLDLDRRLSPLYHSSINTYGVETYNAADIARPASTFLRFFFLDGGTIRLKVPHSPLSEAKIS